MKKFDDPLEKAMQQWPERCMQIWKRGLRELPSFLMYGAVIFGLLIFGPYVAKLFR